jgi:hypothetical protein
MLNFREYIEQVDEDTASPSSVESSETYIRSTTLALVNKIRQLHSQDVRDTSASKSQQRLSSEVMGLAYMMCIVIGVQTNDRVLVQRGRSGF